MANYRENGLNPLLEGYCGKLMEERRALEKSGARELFEKFKEEHPYVEIMEERGEVVDDGYMPPTLSLVRRQKEGPRRYDVRVQVSVRQVRKGSMGIVLSGTQITVYPDYNGRNTALNLRDLFPEEAFEGIRSIPRDRFQEKLGSTLEQMKPFLVNPSKHVSQKQREIGLHRGSGY